MDFEISWQKEDSFITKEGLDYLEVKACASEFYSFENRACVSTWITISSRVILKNLYLNVLQAILTYFIAKISFHQSLNHIYLFFYNHI